jgi:hypothetical protein
MHPVLDGTPNGFTSMRERIHGEEVVALRCHIVSCSNTCCKIIKEMGSSPNPAVAVYPEILGSKIPENPKNNVTKHLLPSYSFPQCWYEPYKNRRASIRIEKTGNRPLFSQDVVNLSHDNYKPLCICRARNTP